MLFSSGDGWFQRTIALQNQSKLCIKVCQGRTLAQNMTQMRRTFVIPAGFV